MALLPFLGLICLASLLLLAAVAKFLSVQSFVSVLERSKLSPPVFAYPLAVFIVGAEATLALCLLLPATRRLALLSGVFLFSCFAAFSLHSFITAPGTPCSCLGTFFAVPSQYMLGIDLVFAALSAFLFQHSTPFINPAHRALSLEE